MKFRYLPLLLLFAFFDVAAQDSGFRLVKISERVYTFVTNGTLNDVVQGNSTVVIGDNEVLVFDTFGDVFTAAAALNALKKITNKPVGYIVNSHWHYDHVMGNYLLKKKYPAAKIITHTWSADQIRKRVPEYIRSDNKDSINSLITELKEVVRFGRRGDSSLLSAYEKEERYPKTIGLLEKFRDHLNQDFAFTDVDLSFTDTLRINLGNQEVQIFFPGLANTKGDLMLYMPDKKILITGDVVVDPIPYAFGSNHKSWVQVLKNINVMDIDWYIPGHGNPRQDKTYIKSLITLFETLNHEIAVAFNNNMTLQQVLQTVRLEALEKEWAGTDEEKKWAFRNYFLKPAIQSVYKEYSSKK